VDVAFIGEAEETWPRFLEDWRNNAAEPRYEQADKTDMTTVPCPRLDLLKMKHYAFGSLQFRVAVRFSASSATLSSCSGAVRG